MPQQDAAQVVARDAFVEQILGLAVARERFPERGSSFVVAAQAVIGRAETVERDAFGFHVMRVAYDRVIDARWRLRAARERERLFDVRERLLATTAQTQRLADVVERARLAHVILQRAHDRERLLIIINRFVVTAEFMISRAEHVERRRFAFLVLQLAHDRARLFSIFDHTLKPAERVISIGQIVERMPFARAVVLCSMQRQRALVSRRRLVVPVLIGEDAPLCGEVINCCAFLFSRTPPHVCAR